MVGNLWAIEVKGTNEVLDKHLKGLRAFKEEGLVPVLGMVSLDPHNRKTADGLHIGPWEIFLRQPWEGTLGRG